MPAAKSAPAEYGRKLIYRPDTKLKVGDRITFFAPCRHGPPRATRIVNGFDHAGRVTVRHHGWGHFVVAAREIKRYEVRR